MKLKDFIEVDVIQGIQDKISDATGLAAIAVDIDGNYITKGSNFTEFCMKYTRGSKEGLKRCVKCDNECSGTYFCHAGLMDFSSDIIVDGQKVGAIIGGQVLPSEPDIEKFKQTARELGIDEAAYIKALNKIPIKSEKSIRVAAEMFKDVVNQLVNLEYFKICNQKKIEIFDTEVKNSLEAVKKITLKNVDLKSIASMENILSLNASIEAARAGQAGVGFTVVAREFGELSKKSTRIYNEISDLISAIEKSILNMHEINF